MKRSISLSEGQVSCGGHIEVDRGKMKKKIREDLVPETEAVEAETPAAVLLDENLLYEVLKHVDARTLGAAGCVNKQWHRTAQDERLWELICTKHSANIGCGYNQLRSVVLALGGFRRLHSQYLWPLSKPSTSSSSSTAASLSAWPCLPPPRTIVPSKPTAKTRWGKDEAMKLIVAGGVFGYKDKEEGETLKSPTVSQWICCGERKYKQKKTTLEGGG